MSTISIECSNQLIPHCTTWAHTSESADGRNTPEYRTVLTSYCSIINALESNPPATKSLRRAFREKGHLSPTANLTAEELVTFILGRIEQRADQYGDFITILHEIQGMNLIARILTGMIIMIYDLLFSLFWLWAGRKLESNNFS